MANHDLIWIVLNLALGIYCLTEYMRSRKVLRETPERAGTREGLGTLLLLMGASLVGSGLVDTARWYFGF